MHQMQGKMLIFPSAMHAITLILKCTYKPYGDNVFFK